MSIIKIALTGGIACGKSKVSQILSNLGLDIISLDKLAQKIVKPNTIELKELIKHFGDDILNTNTSLNRSILRKILLEKKSNQKLIEAILHPRILIRMENEIRKLKAKLVVVEVPLLAEKNLTHLFNRAIIINCNKEQQLKRLINRDNIDTNEAKNMVSTQFSHALRLKLREKLPTDIIENNLEITDLTHKTNQLYKKLINL
ncbi:dephospho-CoA kinase [Candidatus Vesicomyidisocius calyptogenae]|uniref:Dephospho-CoA kinase n=1 Tax=Vesicomyosocius okutanii subsp. Calyptogena okutanii (strain HA) TaxID=412965 RepID=A5CXY2_VESOH|nr:dephospho-CoA kinase [Candidatus Vesicomyosocius okutanii]BAF61202.1 dephospho-CoA kinase [Candidatus Vesicomyosocius okutanii]